MGILWASYIGQPACKPQYTICQIETCPWKSYLFCPKYSKKNLLRTAFNWKYLKCQVVFSTYNILPSIFNGSHFNESLLNLWFLIYTQFPRHNLITITTAVLSIIESSQQKLKYHYLIRVNEIIFIYGKENILLHPDYYSQDEIQNSLCGYHLYVYCV